MNRLEQEVPYASLPALVDGAAERFGDATLWVSIDDSTRISFHEFARLTLKCANALNALGVGNGTHVAVMLPNVPAYVVTWMALARLGAVMVPVNTQYKPRELEYVLQDSDTSFLVIDEACLSTFEEIGNRDALVPPTQLVVYGALDCKLNWQRVVDAAPANPLKWPQPTVDTLMSIQFTSGSTGFPKGCMLTQDYWLVLGWVRSHQGPAPKRMLIDKPLSYMGGKWRFLICLFMGATAYVALRFSLTGLQQRLVDHDIDFFSVTDAVAKLPELPAVSKLNIAWISSGGLSKGLHQPLEQKFNAPVRELYGMTETGSTIYLPIADTAMVGSGSCGLPAPYRDCRIVGPDGNDVAQGAVGELWVKGRGILQAYYNKPDATRSAFAGEWFRTGDLFRQDANGYFYIEGRIKDSIRRSGENISAREIEAVAAGISGVLETAAVGVPDEKRGEEVKLYVVLQPGFSSEQVTPSQVIAYCEDKLAAFKLPRYIEYLADFPRTTSGKIAKHQLDASAGSRRKVFDRSANAWQS
ncbi:MAG: AMP-binding protein [Betaproteobacteria bacterium]|nr:AMP-binding protein [Betaproteobacteria bacterium]